MKPSKLQPALLGGTVSGVLSALPIISAGNLCCCLWVIAGGVVAAYLLQQKDPQPIAPGDGAVVGLLAGVLGAVIGAILSIPINVMCGPMQAEFMERILESTSEIPPQFRHMIESRRAGAQSGPLILLGLVFSLIFGMIFSTIGGLLGAVIFKKKTPPSEVVTTTVNS